MDGNRLMQQVTSIFLGYLMVGFLSWSGLVFSFPFRSEYLDKPVRRNRWVGIIFYWCLQGIQNLCQNCGGWFLFTKDKDEE